MPLPGVAYATCNTSYVSSCYQHVMSGELGDCVKESATIFFFYGRGCFSIFSFLKNVPLEVRPIE